MLGQSLNQQLVEVLCYYRVREVRLLAYALTKSVTIVNFVETNQKATTFPISVNSSFCGRVIENYDTWALFQSLHTCSSLWVVGVDWKKPH